MITWLEALFKKFPINYFSLHSCSHESHRRTRAHDEGISSGLALINSPKHFLCFQEINHQSLRGGVFIITEHHVATVSHLMIKNLTTADSGRYSCSTSAKSRTSVELYVINGAIFSRLVLINAESIPPALFPFSPLKSLSFPSSTHM